MPTRQHDESPERFAEREARADEQCAMTRAQQNRDDAFSLESARRVDEAIHEFYRTRWRRRLCEKDPNGRIDGIGMHRPPQRGG